MTIDLSEVTTETITVRAPDRRLKQIKAFADSFNAVVSFIDTNSIADSEAGIRGPFVGETGVGRVLKDCGRSSRPITDLGQDYDLSIIGITTDSSKLEIDSDTSRTC